VARVLKDSKPAPRLDEQWHKRLREAAFLLLLPLAVYLFACLLTYSAEDPGLLACRRSCARDPQFRRRVSARGSPTSSSS
jgi:hypothetical protein